MLITKLKLENFTVFEDVKIDFSEGINIFIGENGTGKTHMLKVLYSACQASREDIEFEEKLAKVFRPDNMQLGRLVKRTKSDSKNAVIEVYSKESAIKTEFSSRVMKWKEAKTIDKVEWERNFLDSSIFIPAKEILSHSRNFLEAHRAGNIEFDDTYADIIAYAKTNITKGHDTDDRKEYLKDLSDTLRGTVKVEEEKFYLESKKGGKLEFNLLAEGIRKLGLLWQLIKNGSLKKGSVLFWDEPEANINPSAIPMLVDILLYLQSEGVQIFIATHNYVLLKAFDLCKGDNSNLLFYSFSKDEDTVKVNSAQELYELSPNPIIDAYTLLHDKSIMKKLGGLV